MNKNCIFLASGGKSANEEIYDILKDRNVFVFADIDATNEWKDLAKRHNFHFTDWQGSYNKDGIELGEKADFGDFVIEYFKVKQQAMNELKTALGAEPIAVPTCDATESDIKETTHIVQNEPIATEQKETDNKEDITEEELAKLTLLEMHNLANQRNKTYIQ